MSARAPFVPRPPSRVDLNPVDKPASPAAHEAFRPNGLLSSSDGAYTPNAEQHANFSNGLDDSSVHPPLATFKPLNVSGLGKTKSSSQNARPVKSRPSLDGARAPKPFSSTQHRHLATPRPSSPFFPNSGMVSMNAFRAPPPPPSHTLQPPESDDLSSNKAHIGTSFQDHRLGDRTDMQDKSLMSAPPSDSFRFLDCSLVSAHRSRTASHPSLASIHEVDEEDQGSSPRKVQQMGSPTTHAQGTFSGGYSDAGHGDGQFAPGLRRTTKRVDRPVEEEDEYEYGNEAKRYKMALHEDEYTTAAGGRTTPARYSVSEFDRVTTPVRSFPSPPSQDTQKVSGDGQSKQGLYQLLGQDLDICVEAHADAYEQARKRWSECSMEEWTKGADELAGRFAKMLDYVKDHMTTKLSLYASLHNTIAEHRSTLSEREKNLNEARESLVREGGAVVGG